MPDATRPTAPERWLHPPDPEPDAAVRLFLFHHSGGSVTAYRDWTGLLPSDVGAHAVQLPGRQERRGEKPFTRLTPLVDAVADVLAAQWDERPYALFGHSMGALLAYRTAVALRSRGRPPALLAVSGWAPEGFRGLPADGPGGAGGAGDAAAVAAMRDLGGLPERVGEDAEMLAAAARAMAADSAVCRDHVDDGAVVDCPVVAYAGRADPLLDPAAMASWGRRTDRYLGCRVFPEGHFFIRTQVAAVTADLVQLLRRYAVDRPPTRETDHAAWTE
ncbi:thioesterase [Streptomyces spinoverrucosus]|uniref:thioesterase II family protein n=1 Tax=Streptomyces spinoverrucosus TaxID=284043 RepID=UPI0018C359B6|nr:thioesterase [Streptomyces spinoverrucosus]MBG0851769.1 thioesterase [Streptomyces spinoverrucosus]